jgi:hypothetical protein
VKDSYKLILGIDPGKGGGIAVIDHKKGASAMKFPKELEVLSAMMETFIQGYKAKDIHVMIEHVHSFPTDSRPAAFSFGRNLGHWEGILSTYELEINTVAPRKWQLHYDIPTIKDKYERKRWLKEIAQRMFPSIKVTLNICDALLIANYAKEMQYYRQNKEIRNGQSNKHGKSNRYSSSKARNTRKESKTVRASAKNVTKRQSNSSNRGKGRKIK